MCPVPRGRAQLLNLSSTLLFVENVKKYTRVTYCDESIVLEGLIKAVYVNPLRALKIVFLKVVSYYTNNIKLNQNAK